ncbi:unnamed protein product [Polarella glacialis]|uniref:RRM domain-containing protein n=1 Tax=Polarella glacialis TaxID=89957 RepID=A0A813DDL7_POLGL|nr:unnamed protein product [Polarella glacialis]
MATEEAAVPKAKAKRQSTEDLLASFKKKIDQRKAKGQREDVHGATDDIEKIDQKRHEKATVRKEREESSAGGRDERPHERRKSKLLDGPLEEDSRKRRGSSRDRESGSRKRLPEGELEETRIGRGGTITFKRRATEGKRGRGSVALFGRPKTVKISNIPAGLEWKYVQELFEGGAGKVKEGHLDEDGTTGYITFENSDAASKAHYEFDDGEISSQIISVELVEDDDD